MAWASFAAKNTEEVLAVLAMILEKVTCSAIQFEASNALINTQFETSALRDCSAYPFEVNCAVSTDPGLGQMWSVQVHMRLAHSGIW